MTTTSPARDRRAKLRTREELAQYLSTFVPQPQLLDDTKYRRLSELERESYDQSRVRYLSKGFTLNTKQVQAAKRTFWQCVSLNLETDTDCSGLLISGDSTLGKTTVCKAIMLNVFDRHARRYPDIHDEHHTPVVYVEVPPGSTAKGLMRAFAYFFGMTVRPGEPMMSIRNRVVDVLNAQHTQLVVVDEFHNLAARTTGNGETMDALRQLTNAVDATFVYAGIDVLAQLHGPRGQQIAAHFSYIEMPRLNPSSLTDRRTWMEFISGYEDKLLLRHHQQGTLVGLSKYLYERTNGSIGSLSRLLRRAAIQAITDPDINTETLNQQLLDLQPVDIAAQQALEKRLVGKNRPLSAGKILESLRA